MTTMMMAGDDDGDDDDGDDDDGDGEDDDDDYDDDDGVGSLRLGKWHCYLYNISNRNYQLQ